MHRSVSFSLPVLVGGGACLLSVPLPLVTPLGCLLFSLFLFSLLLSDCKSAPTFLCYLPNFSCCNYKPYMSFLNAPVSLSSLYPHYFFSPFSTPFLFFLLCPCSPCPLSAQLLPGLSLGSSR